MFTSLCNSKVETLRPPGGRRQVGPSVRRVALGPLQRRLGVFLFLSALRGHSENSRLQTRAMPSPERTEQAPALGLGASRTVEMQGAPQPPSARYSVRAAGTGRDSSTEGSVRPSPSFPPIVSVSPSTAACCIITGNTPTLPGVSLLTEARASLGCHQVPRVSPWQPRYQIACSRHSRLGPSGL